jgi:L-fuculose-phosphate aldolase
MLLANHGALTVGADLFSAYYKMEIIEHFAKISLVARMLGRENLIAREEVLRLQGLRDTYGIIAPAPICADPADPQGRPVAAGTMDDSGAATCQVVQAPKGAGQRLVPDQPDGRSTRAGDDRIGEETEIRLTYRELSALIEEAIRNLR